MNTGCLRIILSVALSSSLVACGGGDSGSGSSDANGTGALAPAGTACTSSATCASGTCLADPRTNTQYCVEPCGAAGECAVGFACAQGFCVPVDSSQPGGDTQEPGGSNDVNFGGGSMASDMSPDPNAMSGEDEEPSDLGTNDMPGDPPGDGNGVPDDSGDNMDNMSGEPMSNGPGGMNGGGGADLEAQACEERDIPVLSDSAPADGVYSLTGALEASDDFTGSCSLEMNVGFDTVVSFTAPDAGNWIFSTAGSDYDTILYARSTCGDSESELDCNDDSGLGETELERYSSRLKLSLDAGQTIYIFVDAYSSDPMAQANFALSATLEIPPTVNSAEYVYDENAGTFEMYVTGNDPESDTVGARLEFLDDAGTNVLEGVVSITFSGLQAQENDDFSGLLFGLTGDEFPAFTAVKVSVVDDRGQQSAPFDAMPAMSMEVEAGEACDGVARGCSTNNVCSERVCVAESTVATCPPEWTVTAIELAEDGSASIQGDNSEVMNDYRSGSCGGGTATEVYSFTANADGTYVVNLDGIAAEDGEEPDTLLFARTLCDFQYGSDGADLACNDDRVAADMMNMEGNLNSTIEFTATQGQTIYLFTDVYSSRGITPWTGAYTMTISRQ